MGHLEMQTIGNPSWIEFHGTDAAKGRAFYEKVLGWTVNEMPMSDGSSYNVIMIGDEPIGGFSPMPSKEPHWLTYVTVADIDATYKAAIDNGAKPIKEPITMPGIGRMGVFKDPQGTVLAIITYESMTKKE